MAGHRSFEPLVSVASFAHFLLIAAREVRVNPGESSRRFRCSERILSGTGLPEEVSALRVFDVIAG